MRFILWVNLKRHLYHLLGTYEHRYDFGQYYQQKFNCRCAIFGSWFNWCQWVCRPVGLNNYLLKHYSVQNQRIEKLIWLSLLMIDLYLILWPTGFFLRFPHLFMGSSETRRKSFYVNGTIRLVRHESFGGINIIWPIGYGANIIW